jgi:hypothetical protein
MASRFSQIVDAVSTQLADATVTFSKGKLALAENASTRRVCFVPLKADHAYRHDVGGKQHTVGTTPTRSPSFLTRALLCDVYIWDGTPATELTLDRYEATETLLHAVLRAMRIQFVGCVKFLGETWTTQADASGYAVNAELCVLRVSIDIPVTVEDRALTTLDDYAVTMKHEPVSGGAVETIITIVSP